MLAVLSIQAHVIVQRALSTNAVLVASVKDVFVVLIEIPVHAYPMVVVVISGESYSVGANSIESISKISPKISFSFL